MPTQTNTRISASSLGYFLDFELWQNAIRLLNFQIAQKQKNRHYNTLSMFYYERLGPAVNALSTEDYFNDKVASNLFYGLGREFVVFPYNIPKPGLALRSYKFFSYPLRAVY